MALEPIYHLVLFQTIPKRVTPSILKLSKLKSRNVKFLWSESPLECLYAKANESDALKRQFLAKTQLYPYPNCNDKSSSFTSPLTS